VLISAAYAQQAAAAAPDAGGLTQLLPLIFMFVVLWLVMIRPQMKKAKEHKALLESLQKGDEVIVGGGIAGRIAKVGEAYVSVDIAEGVQINVQKPAVQLVLPKGTLKSL
jgi:preprotein translocase subunit YajC